MKKMKNPPVFNDISPVASAHWDAYNHFLEGLRPKMAEYSGNSAFTRQMSSGERGDRAMIGRKEKRKARLTQSPNRRESGRSSSLHPNIPPNRNRVSNEPNRHKASISRSEFESPRADGFKSNSNSQGRKSQHKLGDFNPTVNAASVLREMWRNIRFSDGWKTFLI